jgi:hypothetical protein
MATHSFTVKEALVFGWNTFKKNWQFLIQAFVIIVIAGMIPNWLHDWSKTNLPAASFLFTIISWVVQMVTSIGVIVISLKIVDGKKPNFRDIYKDYSLLLNYFLGSLLYGAVIIVGLILLIVPGVIWGIKYQYTTYLIVDKRMGVWDAFKKSGQITRGVKLKLFLLGLSFIVITLVGVLLAGIGLIVAWPVIALSGAYVYRKLSPKV